LDLRKGAVQGKRIRAGKKRREFECPNYKGKNLLRGENTLTKGGEQEEGEEEEIFASFFDGIEEKREGKKTGTLLQREEGLGSPWKREGECMKKKKWCGRVKKEKVMKWVTGADTGGQGNSVAH